MTRALGTGVLVPFSTTVPSMTKPGAMRKSTFAIVGACRVGRVEVARPFCDATMRFIPFASPLISYVPSDAENTNLSI